MQRMDIDLQMLPIPDWGLVCPGCSYPLRGLPEHRCPECGHMLDIPRLVRPWTRLRDPRFDGTERPLPDFGLQCSACEADLAGAPADECHACGQPFDVLALRPPREWFILDRNICGSLPIPGVQALLAEESVPHAHANDMTVHEIYGGQSSVASRLRVPGEFYFEVLWLVQQVKNEMQRARVARENGDERHWTCPECNESNPSHFDLCWNCEQAQPGSFHDR